MRLRAQPRWGVFLLLSLSLAGLASTGCSNLAYYQQAVAGQIELLSKRRDLQIVIDDPSVSETIRQRLRRAQEITEFAASELDLAVGSTFSTYVDIGRPYVVWNVFSAREFSLELETFCFPIVGCVSYKGFFKEEDALRFAEEQKSKGFEIYMGGVAAYSTLGWFADPLLNTFIQRSDEQLASLIFHELAHKSLYLPGDTGFNESFATAVERYGLKRWLSSSDTYNTFIAAQGRRQAVITLILESRNRLLEVYKQDENLDRKRQLKSEILADLVKSYDILRNSWLGGNEFEFWMNSDINNAKLGAIGAYQEWVPAFSTLLEQSASFEQFVEKVQRLANLPVADRRQRLEKLVRDSVTSRYTPG